MVYLFVYVPLAIWMFIDAKRRRYDAGKWWAIGTTLFCPITAPFYFASRNLRKGESREGGTPWNVLKNFALFWTVTMAIATLSGMADLAGSGDTSQDEYEQAGAAIGTAIGLGLLFLIWFFPMLGALVLGMFLKKSSVVETGPTGALALQDEVDYKLSDFADQVKAASQVAASKVQSLANEVKDKSAGSASPGSGTPKGPAAMLTNARDLIGSGKRDEAITLLRDIIAFFPDTPEASSAKAALQRAGVAID